MCNDDDKGFQLDSIVSFWYVIFREKSNASFVSYVSIVSRISVIYKSCNYMVSNACMVLSTSE